VNRDHPTSRTVEAHRSGRARSSETGTVRHRAAARVLQAQHRDDAVARASSRKLPLPASPAFALRASAFAKATADKTAGQAAAHSCRALQSRAAALPAARVSADRRPGGMSVHGVACRAVARSAKAGGGRGTRGQGKREKAEGTEFFPFAVRRRSRWISPRPPSPCHRDRHPAGRGCQAVNREFTSVGR